VCQSGSVNQLESTVALVGRRTAGYRATVPQDEGVSALAPLAHGAATGTEHRKVTREKGRIILTPEPWRISTSFGLDFGGSRNEET